MGRNRVEGGFGAPIRSQSGNPIGQPYGKSFDLYRAGITGADVSPSFLPIYEADGEIPSAKVRMVDVLVKADLTAGGTVGLKFFNRVEGVGDAELVDEAKALSFDTGVSLKQFTINQFGGTNLVVMVDSFGVTGTIDIYLKPAQ